MDRLELTIVTPDSKKLQVTAKKISLPTPFGEITILPHHEAMVSLVSSGEIKIISEGKVLEMHIAGGVVKVELGGKVNILADAAERVEELSIERAELARKKAQEALSQERLSDMEYATAAAALERSMSRIRIIKKKSHTRTSPVTGEGVLHD